jgi:hypothetical protein
VLEVPRRCPGSAREVTRRCWVGLNSLKSLNLTKLYPNNNKNNKVKSKPLELYELAGKNSKKLKDFEKQIAQAPHTVAPNYIGCPTGKLISTWSQVDPNDII